MSIKNLYRKYATLTFMAAVVAATFWLLDSQGLSTGDDLGYMFTDTKLHSGDGHRVASVADVVATQQSHYNTTNGRVLVHSITQLMLIDSQRRVYHVCNAMMFALLWLFTLYYIYGRRRTFAMQGWQALAAGMAAGLGLWISIPYPGVNVLSLTAYALNYLWPAVATIGVMLLYRHAAYIKGAWRMATALVLTALCALMQESFSLPMTGALILYTIIYRKRICKLQLWIMVCYTLGTALLVLAPGNFARAGETMTLSTLVYRWKAFGTELVWSAVSVLAAMVIAYAIWWRTGLKRMWRKNAVALLFVALSVGLCLVQYTAARQLMGMCVVSGILVMREVFRSRVWRNIGNKKKAGILTLIFAAMIVGAYTVRRTTFQRTQGAIEMVKNGDSIVYPTIDIEPCYESRAYMILSRFDDDPFEGSFLVILADTYTKQGYGRLYGKGAKQIAGVMPKEPRIVMEAASRATHHGEKVHPGHIDSHWSSFALKRTEDLPTLTDGRGAHLGYERYQTPDSTYFVTKRADEIRYEFTD